MNSKAIVFLLIAGLVYAGFLWAHRAYDERAQVNAVSEVSYFDGAPFVQRLMREGVSALPQVREELAKKGESSNLFLEALPKKNESWAQELAALETKTPSQEDIRDLRVISPRGKQSSPPRFVQVNRGGTGTAWVSVLEVLSGGESKVLAKQKISVNVVQKLPLNDQLKPGARYRVLASNHEDGASSVESVFTMISPAEKAHLKERMSVLKRHIPEVRPRIFMQACLAMSFDLYDDARGLFYNRMPRASNNVLEVGLIERLIVLDRHAQNQVHQNQLLTQLKTLR